MKHIKNVFTALVLLMFGMQFAWSAPTNEQRLTVVHTSATIEPYNAIESDALRISINAGGSGFVEGKVCDSCELLKVIVTPATKAFANNVEMPLTAAKARLGRYAVVIYDVETKNVTEIRW